MRIGQFHLTNLDESVELFIITKMIFQDPRFHFLRIDPNVFGIIKIKLLDFFFLTQQACFYFLEGKKDAEDEQIPTLTPAKFAINFLKNSTLAESDHKISGHCFFQNFEKNQEAFEIINQDNNLF